MASSVNDDIFFGYITARKVFYIAKGEGVDMQKLLKHEFAHYKELKRTHKKSYQASRIRINSYLAELSGLVLLDNVERTDI